MAVAVVLCDVGIDGELDGGAMDAVDVGDGVGFVIGDDGTGVVVVAVCVGGVVGGVGGGGIGCVDAVGVGGVDGVVDGTASGGVDVGVGVGGGGGR